MARVWVVMAGLMVLAAAVTLGERGVAAAGQAGAQTQPAEVPHPSPLSKGEGAVRFEAIDIFVDSGGASLAAYQVEVKATAADVKLVGVEGGEHPAFAAAPHYDPAALHEGQLRERVVVAAFSTDAGLPKGRTRVARLHVQAGGDEAKYEVRLETAGGPDGRQIEARAEWRPAGGGAGDRK